MLDTVLGWVVVVLPTAFGVVCAMQALSPPKKEHHKRWFAAFITAGLIGSGGVLWQQTRTNGQNVSDREKLQGQITQLIKTTTETHSEVTETRTAIKDMQSQTKSPSPGTPPTRVIISAPPTQRPLLTPNPKPTDEPAIQSELRVSQRRVDSDDKEAPYALQVVIQTNVVIQPTGLLIHCNGEIHKGSFFVAGQPVMMSMAEGWKGSDYQLQFGFPAWAPESAVVVTLFSKSAIRVTGVERLRL